MDNVQEKLKQISIVDYVEYQFNTKTVRINNNMFRANPAPCCGHNDCFTLYVNTNTWHCFSCAKGGDLANLLMDTGRATDFKQALQILGLDDKPQIEFKAAPVVIEPMITPIPTVIEPIINPVVEPTQIKENYFNSRGLSNEIIAKYNLHIEGNMAILPCGVKRNLNGDVKYMNEKGTSVSFFNSDYLKNDGIYFVCEGIFDALSIEELGFKAISLNSANNVAKFTKDLNTDSIIISAFDNDEAGNKASIELAKYCAVKGISFERLNVAPYKDVNEILIANKNELLKRIITVANIQQSRANSFDDLANKKKMDYISTGLTAFDNALGGGLIADLYCVGGVPGSGKSALMLQIASSLSVQNNHVLYISLELSANEIDSRNASRITFNRNKDCFLTALEINSGNIANDKKGIMTTIKEEYQSTFRNFYVDNTCKTVKDITARVKRHKIITGVAPIVIVDYIQQLQGEENKTEKQTIDDAVLELKRLSNTYNTAVMFIASLNRQGYKANDMASFKESGGVEYTAAVAMALRPSSNGLATIAAKKQGNAMELPIEMELDIMKNRHYIPKTIKLDFYGAGNCFKEHSFF